MKRFSLLIGFLAFTQLASAQLNPRLEFSTGFPYQGFQSAPREYFLTTQYTLSGSINWKSYSDFVATFSYTQQNAPIRQDVSYISALNESRTIYVPFTTDPYYSEYGFFLGGRLKSHTTVAEVFLSGQLGIVGAKYGTITQSNYYYGALIDGNTNRAIQGSVIDFQIAAMYGMGILFHATNTFGILADIHAINRFTAEPLDVYQSIGLQFTL